VNDEYLTLAQAADYVEVNRVKFSRMAKKLAIPSIPSPFDERVKLFKRADLDVLKQAPRPLRDAEEEESARPAVLDRDGP
jgi:hypothetical protein